MDPITELLFWGLAFVVIGGGIAVLGAWVERKPARADRLAQWIFRV